MERVRTVIVKLFTIKTYKRFRSIFKNAYLWSNSECVLTVDGSTMFQYTFLKAYDKHSRTQLNGFLLQKIDKESHLFLPTSAYSYCDDYSNSISCKLKPFVLFYGYHIHPGILSSSRNKYLNRVYGLCSVIPRLLAKDANHISRTP